MSFKNQSVFSSVYTNTTFTITEDMQLSEVVIELMSGSATLLGGLQVPGLTLDPVAITVGQPVVLNADSGYTLTDITIDSTAGGVFEIYGTYQYIDAVDASAAAYFTATGITGATQQAAIDNLVKSLKGYGLWSKMKAIYPFVTDNYNLLGFTEDFTAGYWGKDAGVTATSNTTIAPDGSNTADTITLPLDGNSAIYTQPAVTALTTYTVSFYIRATSGQAGNTVCFRTNPGLTTNMITLTNDWVRHSVVVTPTSGSWSIEWGRKNSATATSFFLWGAQLQLGSTATTYQAISSTQQAFIANQFKYNLKDPRDLDAAFRLVFNGGWTFSSTGALPNGTNGYADTKLIAQTNMFGKDYSIGYYSRTNSDGLFADIGNFGTNTGNSLSIYTRFSNVFYLDLPVETARYTISYTTSLGYFISNNATSVGRTIFNNLSKIAGVSFSNNDFPVNANPNIVLSNSYLLATSRPSNRQLAFANFGTAFTDTETTNLYIAVQTYQEALSRQVGVPVVSDPNAQAFIDAAEITDVTQADAINNLVIGLKYDNLWNKMTAIYPFVGGTASTHKFNLKDPRDLDAAYRLVFNGGWTHSSTGATPNGANGYADTFLSPLSVLQLNNTSYSVYTNQNNVGYKMGIDDGGSSSWIRGVNSNSTQVTDHANNGVFTPLIFVQDKGLVLANRTSSTSDSVFNNNVKFTRLNSTSGRSSRNYFIGAYNGASGAGGYTNAQFRFGHMGSGLTDADASNLYNRVQTYQTALSRQVS